MRRQPRIEPESQPGEEQTRILAKTLLTPESEPLNLFRVLVRDPELMKRVNALGGKFMAHGSLPDHEREIVILRVSWKTGCDYEYAQHAAIALRVGLTVKQVSDLGGEAESGEWSESEIGLIRFTDEVLNDLEVSDETWDLVAESHDENQMMELVLLVGYYQMLAAFLKTLRVPLEKGASGLPTR